MAKHSMTISGVGRLRKRFEDRRRKVGNASVAVGYTANYALWVHEMVGANFQAPGTQAKFLEAPARQMRQELVNIIDTAMRKGASLQAALFMAGLALQRASQLVCPRDTGNLRASAFTRIE